MDRWITGVYCSSIITFCTPDAPSLIWICSIIYRQNMSWVARNSSDPWDWPSRAVFLSLQQPFRWQYKRFVCLRPLLNIRRSYSPAHPIYPGSYNASLCWSVNHIIAVQLLPAVCQLCHCMKSLNHELTLEGDFVCLQWHPTSPSMFYPISPLVRPPR